MQVLLGHIHAADTTRQPTDPASRHNVFLWQPQHTLGGLQQYLGFSFCTWSHYQLQNRQEHATNMFHFTAQFEKMLMNADPLIWNKPDREDWFHVIIVTYIL